MQELEVSGAELARRVGVKQPSISRLLTGDASGSKHLHIIARALGTTAEYLTGETDDPSEGALPAPSPELLADQLGVVEIKELDLSLGMGATYLDIPVTSQSRHFSIDWVRSYTNSPPDKLFFARGSGDSMMPTIHNSDMLLIDCSQQSIRMSDQIWAIAYGMTGMIKRLRPMPDGSVKIMSDNPLVETEVAVDGEMHVLGRVVAVIRKI